MILTSNLEDIRKLAQRRTKETNNLNANIYNMIDTLTMHLLRLKAFVELGADGSKTSG